MAQTRQRSVVRRLGATLARLRVHEPDAAEATEVVDEPPEAEAEPPADRLRSRLTGLSWDQQPDGRTRLLISGSAWREGGDATGSRVTAVTLSYGGRRVQCAVQERPDPEINDHAADPDNDRSGAGFVAVADATDLIPDAPAHRVFQRTYRVEITVADADGEVRDRFRSRDDKSSPGDMHSCAIGAHCLAQGVWESESGLGITVARRVVFAEQVRFAGAELHAVVGCRGDFVPAGALIRRGRHEQPVAFEPLEAGRFRVSGPVGELPGQVDQPEHGRTTSWYLQLVDADGEKRNVHWDGVVPRGHRVICPADPRIAVRYSPNGVIRLDVHLRRLIADQATVDDGGTELTVAGECHGLPADPARWQLTGGHRPVPAGSVDLADGRFSARFPLHEVPEWGRSVRPLPSANRRLAVSADPLPGAKERDEERDEVIAGTDPGFVETLPRLLRTESHRIRLERESGGRLRIVIGPPREPGEVSRYSRRRFEVTHRTRPVRPIEAVWLDSFDGRSTGDNVLPIRNELVRRRPDLRRIWTVADLSVEVPDGDESALIRSEPWWQALSVSRLVVTNCWTPAQFRRRDHQRVLQTWHGTPLKLLGFNRIGTKRGIEYEIRTRREVSQWNWLIAQNPYSAGIFRSAYGYQNRILDIGYPRNDILVNADDDHRAAVRERLGIGSDERVVLYVPTWRENSKGLFTGLDFTALCDALGDRGRLLVRGHANTVRHGSGVVGERLLDVTLYPDLADLYLIADVMITDYSSTMFDYSITGKPMIFFAPDIEDYAGRMRGTYFDLAEEAPGPILQNTDQVIEALDDLTGIAEQYRDQYAAWQRKFNPYDDGHAAERAVDVLLEGLD